MNGRPNGFSKKRTGQRDSTKRSHPSMAARVLGFKEIASAASRLRTAAAPEVALFWDGGCPLCRKEIAYYKFLDHERRVDWVDIDATPEALQPHRVQQKDAMAKIHAFDSTTSTILVGVPAFMAVWERLPYWNVLPPLLHSMPFALPAVDAAYAFWAKRRLGLTGRLRTLEQGSACNK